MHRSQPSSPFADSQCSARAKNKKQCSHSPNEVSPSLEMWIERTEIRGYKDKGEESWCHCRTAPPFFPHHSPFESADLAQKRPREISQSTKLDSGSSDRGGRGREGEVVNARPTRYVENRSNYAMVTGLFLAVWFSSLILILRDFVAVRRS